MTSESERSKHCSRHLEVTTRYHKNFHVSNDSSRFKKGLSDLSSSDFTPLSDIILHPFKIGGVLSRKVEGDVTDRGEVTSSFQICNCPPTSLYATEHLGNTTPLLL